MALSCTRVGCKLPSNFFVQLRASATYSHTGIEAAMTPCGIGGSHRNAAMHGAFRQGRTLLDVFWSERRYVRAVMSVRGACIHVTFRPGSGFE